MKYFSLFSGVGGFEQGMPKEWECVGFSETDKYASQVLRYRFPNVKNYSDCSKIDYGKVPDFDLLTGGSPCQDFSIAGKRAGIVGSRSGLVWEYIRTLKEKQPRYFIWENVRGVMSTRGGWDFANILIAFSQQGYSLWWQVLNAKDFGVPQNRERIFVVGFREGSPKEVFFEREDTKTTYEQSGDELREQVANTLRTNYSNGRSNETYIQVQNPGASQHYRVYGEEGLAPTLQSQSGMSSQKHPFVMAYSKSHRTGKSEDGAVRKLMPIECEALMGWERNWTKYGINEKGEKVEMSDSQRYKMAGNGVVSNVVRGLVKELIPA